MGYALRPFFAGLAAPLGPPAVTRTISCEGAAAVDSAPICRSARPVSIMAFPITYGTSITSPARAPIFERMNMGLGSGGLVGGFREPQPGQDGDRAGNHAVGPVGELQLHVRRAVSQ